MPTYQEKLLQVLQRCKGEGLLIGCSQWDSDKDSFIVGFVDKVTEDGASFNLISPDGEPDGVWFGELTQVTRFHYDTEYLRSVQSLYHHRSEVYKDEKPAPQLNSDSLNIYIDILKQAMEMKRIVRVVDYDKTRLCGFVIDVGEDYFELQIIDANTGSIDGFYVVDVDDVHHISYSSKDEMKVEFLHRKRYALL